MKVYIKNGFKILLLTSLLGSTVSFAQSSSPSTSAPTSTAAPVANNSTSSQVDPKVFVQGIVDQVLTILENNQIPASGSTPASTNVAAALPLITQVLSSSIDLPTISTFLVPPAIWQAASTADQKAFELALLGFMAGLYNTALAQYNPVQFSVLVNAYRGNYANQPRIQINSTIVNNTNPAGNVSVAFVLESVGNSWMFLDFSINNSLSVASNVQAQILGIVKNLQANNSSPPPLSALTEIIAQHNQPNIGN
ncbi:MAG: ABC transporter substrate-binding protein [Pseudomonadota bacterium]